MHPQIRGSLVSDEYASIGSRGQGELRSEETFAWSPGRSYQENENSVLKQMSLILH